MYSGIIKEDNCLLDIILRIQTYYGVRDTYFSKLLLSLLSGGGSPRACTAQWVHTAVPCHTHWINLWVEGPFYPCYMPSCSCCIQLQEGHLGTHYNGHASQPENLRKAATHYPSSGETYPMAVTSSFGPGQFPKFPGSAHGSPVFSMHYISVCWAQAVQLTLLVSLKELL